MFCLNGILFDPKFDSNQFDLIQFNTGKHIFLLSRDKHILLRFYSTGIIIKRELVNVTYLSSRESIWFDSVLFILVHSNNLIYNTGKHHVFHQDPVQKKQKYKNKEPLTSSLFSTSNQREMPGRGCVRISVVLSIHRLCKRQHKNTTWIICNQVEGEWLSRLYSRCNKNMHKLRKLFEWSGKSRILYNLIIVRGMKRYKPENTCN